MTVRHRIRWLMLTASIVAGAVLTLWLIEDQHYTSAVVRRTESVTARSEHLADLNAALGYGGLIHSMKNFVLRGDQAYVQAFDAAHDSAIGTLATYRRLPELSPAEISNLDRIGVVVDDYRYAMDRAIALVGARPSSNTPSPEEIDEQVRVDDADAFAALSVLAECRSQIGSAISRDVERARFIIGVAKIGIGVAGLGLFVFLARRITKPITSPMIAFGDGTELAASEAAELVLQRHELRAILDAVPAYIYFKDNDNRILNLNKASADAIGLPVGEIIGRHTSEFFPPDHAERFLKDDLDVISNGEAKLGIEENHNTDTHGARLIVTDKIPLTGPSGEIDRIVAIATDVTEIRHAEAQINEMNRLLEQSLRHGKQGGWSWNIRNGDVRFSDTWYTMLGYEPGEFPMDFSTWERLVHPDDFETAIQTLHDHLAGRTSEYDLPIRMRCQDGTWRWIRTVGEVAERDTDGEPISVAGMHIDIDREHRLGEQLQRKTDEMERFVYTASHDLKSPIVTILGFLSHLERSLETGETDKAVRYIEILKSAGLQMQSNVEDILEVSRVGRMTVLPESVGVADALVEIESVLSEAIRESGAKIVTDLRAPTIWCDRRHIVSVLTNLIGNALKYARSEHGLVIAIRTRTQSDGSVRLDVHDNGPGIDPSYAARIFQLFECLSTESDGTGIGLAIVGRIAETWGGSAWLEPTESGACFSITFQAKSVAPAATNKPKESDHVHAAGQDGHQTLLAG